MGAVSGPRPVVRGAVEHGPQDGVGMERLVRWCAAVGPVWSLGRPDRRYTLLDGGSLCLPPYSQVRHIMRNSRARMKILE